MFKTIKNMNKKLLFLSATLILGISFLLGVQISLAEGVTSADIGVSGTVSLVGASEDKVFKWAGDDALHTPDWKWSISLSNSSSTAKTIKKMVIVHNVVGEGWATDDSTNNPVNKSLYLLGTTRSQSADASVFNMYTNNLGFTLGANSTINFYAYGANWLASQRFSGGYLMVYFTDDTSAKITIPASDLVPGTAPTSTTYPLALNPSGSNGTIVSSPAGINCSVINGTPGLTSGTCGASFPAGTTVTLTATPASGGVFTSWNSSNSACSGGSPICTLTMNQGYEIYAIFSSAQSPIIISDVRVENISDTVAKISWNTDILSNTWVYYGKTANYDGGGVQQVDNQSSVRQHSAILNYLEPGIKYYYKVSSRVEGSSGTAASKTGEFTSISSAQPSITVLSPNGGESFKAGDSVQIRWQKSGNSNN